MFFSKKDLTNVLSVLVFSPTDNTFLLLLDESRGDYWIPSFKMDDRYSWKDNLQEFKKKLFNYEVINEKLLKIFKIWTLEKEYLHLIFQISLPKDVKTSYKTETSIGKVGWFTCAQLAKLKPLLRSLEVLEVTNIYKPTIYRETEKVTGEMVPMGTLTEIMESDILISFENFELKNYVELLDSAGFTTSEQYDLYEGYFMHTYPCIYMNHITFQRAMRRFNFLGDLESLFRAADVWKRDFLTFQDYLFLISVMQPYTTHYGHLAEIRSVICRCTCTNITKYSSNRYYDENKDGKLDYNNFINLISDIQVLKNPNCTKLELNKEAEITAKSIDFKANSQMTFDQFYSCVIQTKIRDTSLLLRLQQNHFDISESDFSRSIQRFMPHRIIIPSCPLSEEQDSSYSIVLKTKILKPGETPFEIKDMKLLEDTMTKSVSEDLKSLTNIKLMRLDSADLDEKVSELFLALKYFSSEVNSPSVNPEALELERKKSYTWGSAYIDKLGITLILICEHLKSVLAAEPRLLEIEPPVFIMGDLHGNFHDLMCFEKTLWANGIALGPAKLLFLGDYVDRGPNSVEVIMYLFGNKFKNPSKLYLIRGNHEIRDIQKLFTFQRECTFKFGNTLGMSVWKAVNEVFDVMPLAGIIDHKVFCCHGGIPPPWLCPTVEIINTIPCPLANCERQSPLAWTLMWNDPLKTGIARNSFQQLELLTHEGFLPNVQRGTGFYFSCDALEKFLMTNSLSHVVRAHEVVRAGFQIHQKGKLLTVFSSSGYCGGKNFAGSVLVADKFLRVCMVDTGINQRETQSL